MSQVFSAHSTIKKKNSLLSNNDHYNLHFFLCFAKKTSSDFFFSPSVLLRLSPSMSTVSRVFSIVRFIPDLSTQGYCKVTRKEISFLFPCLLSYLLFSHVAKT